MRFTLALLLVSILAGVAIAAKPATNIPRLIDALAEPDSAQAESARKALLQLGPRAVEPLIAVLHDQRWDVRNQAAELLGQLGDSRAVEPLIAAMSTDTYAVFTALGQLHDRRAVEPMLAFMKKTGVEDEYIIPALGELGDPRAVPVLLTRLTERDGEYCHHAIAVALAKIGLPDPAPLLALSTSKTEYVREGVAETLGLLRDPRGVPALLAMLRTERHPYAIFDALGRIRDPRAVDGLLESMSSPVADMKEGSVRGRAAYMALLQIGTPAVDALIAALRHQQFRIRACAAMVLGAMRDPRAIEPLAAGLNDPDLHARYAIACALSAFSEDHPEDATTPPAHEGVEVTRVTLVFASRPAKDPRVIAALVDVLQELCRKTAPTGMERQDYACDELLAEKLYWSIADRLKGVRDPRMVDGLLAALALDPDDFIKERIIEALGATRDPRAVEPLLAAAKDVDNDVRYKAVVALPGYNDPRVVPALIAALKDPDQTVRRYAAIALGETKDERAVEPLFSVFANKNDYWWFDDAACSLAQIRAPGILERCLAMLDDPNEENRGLALRILGGLQDRRAVAPLLTHLQKGDLNNEAVRNALLNIGDLSALRALIETTNEYDARQTQTLIRMLKSRPHPPELPAVVALLCKPSNGARYTAIIILNQIWSRSATKPMAALLAEKDLELRLAAAVVLADHHDKRGFAALYDALKDPDASIRSRAIFYLAQFTDRHAMQASSAFLRDTLHELNAGSHLDPAPCAGAIEILTAHRTPESLPLTIELVARLLDEPDISPAMSWFTAMQAGLRALGRSKDPRAVTVLLQALTYHEYTVRRDAASALEQLSGKHYGINPARWQAWWDSQRKPG